MSFARLSSLACSSHQAFAGIVTAAYAALVLVSIMRHSERAHIHHLMLRGASLLRDAAKSSLKADEGDRPLDVFTDATKANIYVSAVDRIMSPAEVSNLTGISIDEMRAYTSSQVDDAMRKLHHGGARSTDTSCIKAAFRIK